METTSSARRPARERGGAARRAARLAAFTLALGAALTLTFAPAAQAQTDWLRSYAGGISIYAPVGLVELDDGSFVVLTPTAQLLCVDATGLPLWRVDLGDQTTVASALAAGTDELVVAGRIIGRDGGGWVTWLDLQGRVLEQRVFQRGTSPAFTAAALGPDGGAWLAGRTEVSGSAEGWIVRLAADRSVAWERTFGEAGFDVFEDLVVDPLGAVVSWHHERPGTSERQAWHLALDEAGATRWVRHLISGVEGTALLPVGIARRDDGTLVSVLSGRISSGRGTWIAELAPDGSVQRIRGFGEGRTQLQATAGDGRVLVARLGTSDVRASTSLLSEAGDVAWHADASSSLAWTFARDGDLVAAGRNLFGRFSTIPGCDLASDLPPPAVEPATWETGSSLHSGLLGPGIWSPRVGPETRRNFSVTATCGDAGPCETTLADPVPLRVAGVACGTEVRTATLTPTLEWEPVDEAFGVRWELFAGGDCTGTPVDFGDADAAARSVTAVASGEGVHSWRLVARGDGGSACDSMGTCACPFTIDASAPCADDGAEPDDTPDEAMLVRLGDPVRQRLLCDEDWLTWSVRAGTAHEIETHDLIGGADTVISLHDPGDGSVIATDDDSGSEPGASRLEWTPTVSGPVLLRVRASDGTDGPGQGYSLRLECRSPCGDSWSQGLPGLTRSIDRTVLDDGSVALLATDEADRAWVGCFAPDGELRWQHSVEGLGAGELLALAPRAGGGVHLLGSTTLGTDDSGNPWAAALEADGALAWQRELDFGTRTTWDTWTHGTAAADGGLVAAGLTTATLAHSMLVARYGDRGELVSTWRIAGSHPVTPEGVLELAGDRLALLATTRWEDPSVPDLVLDVVSVTELVDHGTLSGPRWTTSWYGTNAGNLQQAAGGLAVGTSREIVFLDPDGSLKPSCTTSASAWRLEGLADGRLAMGWNEPDAAGIAILDADCRGTRVSLSTDPSVRVGWVDELPQGGLALVGSRDEGMTTVPWIARTNLASGLACAERRAEPLSSSASAPWELDVSLEVERLTRTTAFAGVTTSAGTVSPDVVCAVSEPVAPTEVSGPGATLHLVVEARERLRWDDPEASESDTFNVYRGDLEAVGDPSAPLCWREALTAPSTLDPELPGAGRGWFYLVTGVNAAGEGPAGTDSQGRGRHVADPCP